MDGILLKASTVRNHACPGMDRTIGDSDFSTANDFPRSHGAAK